MNTICVDFLSVAMTRSPPSSPTHGPSEEVWKKKLSEVRNPLFLELAESNLPFSGKWRDILKRLPDVQKESHRNYAQSGRHRPCAYLNPAPEIKKIRVAVVSSGSDSIDADCLQMALNNWVDHNGGQATVADLLHVLELVKLGDAGRRFFREYFALPDN